MTNIIHKYQLNRKDSQLTTWWGKPTFLKVKPQNGVLCLWALLDQDEPTQTVEIVMIGTGQAFDVDNLNYIDTVQDGIFVWHFFSRK